MGVVARYVEQAAVLEARERMQGIVDHAAAVGRLKRGAHRAHLRDLKRAAAGTRPPAHVERSSAPAPSEAPIDDDTLARAEAIGIGIEIVRLSDSDSGESDG